MIPDPGDFAALVAEANLAPSVHNTQPTRWRLEPDGAVLVLEDVTRRLTVGDPLGRDADVSHGAAIEGFALAAGGRGWSVGVEPLNGSVAQALRPVARLTVSPGGAPDPLNASLPTRRTYRGRFAGRVAADALRALEHGGDVRIVGDGEGIARLATLNDSGSLKSFRNRAFRAELLSWMRLRRGHPCWTLDGLNAEAMAMSPVEALGAGFVLRPTVFEALDGVGLASPLTGEAAVVRSASAVVLFHRPVEEPPLATGRRFHRLWLELTRLNFAAAPMAVLADDPEIRAEVRHAFGLPSGRRLITAFRVGPVATARQPAKARLPLSRLLV